MSHVQMIESNYGEVMSGVETSVESEVCMHVRRRRRKGLI